MAAKGSRERFRVVLDASVVAKWIIPGEPWESESALLKDKISERLVEAHAPALLLYEVASVVSRAVRGGALSEKDASEALALLEYLLKVHPARWQDLPEIVKMSLRTGLTVYDAAYLHLSARIGAVLVTANEELVAKSKGFAEALLVADLARRLEE